MTSPSNDNEDEIGEIIRADSFGEPFKCPCGCGSIHAFAFDEGGNVILQVSFKRAGWDQFMSEIIEVDTPESNERAN